LRRDENDLSSGPHVGQVLSDKVSGVGPAHVFGHVCKEKRVKVRWHCMTRSAKGLRCERGETARRRDRDGLGVVVNAYSGTAQVGEVPPEATAHVEHESKPQTPQVPAVRTLDV